MNREEFLLDYEDLDSEAIFFNKGINIAFDYLEEQLRVKDKEIQELKNNVDKNTFKDYKFTNCNDCVNKVDNKFTETCFNCKRYYGCMFERKEDG